MQELDEYVGLEKMRKFGIILLFLSGPLFAQTLSPEWKVGAEADFFFQLAHRPSSDQGHTSFDFSRLKVSPYVKVNDEFAMAFRFSLAEERSANENNYLSELENVYIQYKDPNFEKWTHELGLIRPFWLREQGVLIEQFDFFGSASVTLAKRYKFMSDGDLGYQGRWQLNETAFATFGMVNGEENKSAEIGPSKEFFIGYFWQGETQLFHFLASAGHVDNLDSKISPKNRAQLRYQKDLGRLTLGLEALWAQDPSPDYASESRAEGMTFTELATPRGITTEAGRAEAYYRLSERQTVLVRYDSLRPELSKKQVESVTWAWVQKETGAFQWGLFYEQTYYGAQHSSQARQKERIRLGLSLSF